MIAEFSENHPIFMIGVFSTVLLAGSVVIALALAGISV